MLTKTVVLLLTIFVASSFSQICLSISGPCLLHESCLTGSKCIEDVCCVLNASQNCNNTLYDDFCDAHVHQCNDPIFKDTMTKQCAKSCMTCELLIPTTTIAPPPITGSPSAPCNDVNPSECQKYSRLCLNIHYFDFLTAYCPKTCNRCNYVPYPYSPPHHNHGHCVDKTKTDGTSDCPSEVGLCNNPLYYDLMTIECPKTCGRCHENNNKEAAVELLKEATTTTELPI